MFGVGDNDTDGANKAAVDRLDQTAVLPEDWRERLAAGAVEPVEGGTGRHPRGTGELPKTRAGLRIAP